MLAIICIVAVIILVMLANMATQPPHNEKLKNYCIQFDSANETFMPYYKHGNDRTPLTASLGYTTEEEAREQIHITIELLRKKRFNDRLISA